MNQTKNSDIGPSLVFPRLNKTRFC